jgi:hypothetical protein
VRFERQANFLIGAAYAWAVANCVYVYLIANRAKSYRLETATLILVAVLLPGAFVSKRFDNSQRQWSRAQRTLVVGLAAAAWSATLVPLLRFSFLSDDYVFLERYRSFHGALMPQYFFRPAFSILFWLANRVGDGSPMPFHLLSLVLHVASSMCVYVLARRLLFGNAPATLAAIIFLLNPLQLEASLWISGLQEELWTFFLIAASVVYVAREDVTIGRVMAAAALAGLALLSKETAGCFVLVFLTLDLLLRRLRARFLGIVAYAIFTGELVLYLWLRSHFASTIDRQIAVTPSRYFFKQFLTTPYRAFAFPWNAEALDVPAVVMCTIAIALLTAVAIACRRRAWPLLGGAAIILITTAPLAGYFYVGADLSSARYLYFAAVGWAFIMSELIIRTLRRPAAQVTVGVALTLALAVALRGNLRPWQTAGQMIHALDSELQQGSSPADVFDDWRTRHGVALRFNAAGLPDNYHGVYIFRNGYPEYLRIRQAR